MYLRILIENMIIDTVWIVVVAFVFLLDVIFRYDGCFVRQSRRILIVFAIKKSNDVFPFEQLIFLVDIAESCVAQEDRLTSS